MDYPRQASRPQAKNHRPLRPLILILLSLFFLAALQFLDIKAKIGPMQLRGFDICFGFMDKFKLFMWPPERLALASRLPRGESQAPELRYFEDPLDLLRLYPQEGVFDPKDIEPSQREKLSYVAKLEPQKIHEYAIDGASGGLRGLARRFRDSVGPDGKLRQSLRIAYIGDSSVEGDLFAQDLREALQRRYGGRGVGLMPMTSIVANYRVSISQSFSDDWRDVHLLENEGQVALGPMGHTFFPKALAHDFNPSESLESLAEFETRASWTRFKANPTTFNAGSFRSFELFYSKVDSPSYLLINADGRRSLRRLEEGPEARGLRVFLDKDSQTLKLSFLSKRSFEVYGLSFDDGPGFYVDDIPYRGIDGHQFQWLDPEVLGRMQAELGWDLVILQFGLNVANKGQQRFRGFGNSMVELSSFYRSNLPGADILIVGTHDMGVRSEDGSIVSNPAVPFLCWDLDRAARRANLAFFNMYGAMGGPGSMARMVQAKEANKDYTHLNQKGSRRAGSILSEAIDAAIHN